MIEVDAGVLNGAQLRGVDYARGCIGLELFHSSGALMRFMPHSFVQLGMPSPFNGHSGGRVNSVLVPDVTVCGTS